MGISNFFYGKIAGKSGFKVNKFKSACPRASQVVLVLKYPPTNEGHIRDVSLIPGSERSAGAGHGNPLQYSCLANPMGRGAWQATVHRVPKESDVTRLNNITAMSSTLRFRDIK